jgi:hypothetical protein
MILSVSNEKELHQKHRSRIVDVPGHHGLKLSAVSIFVMLRVTASLVLGGTEHGFDASDSDMELFEIHSRSVGSHLRRTANGIHTRTLGWSRLCEKF